MEVFSSMQGEGVLIGCRQIFVRFADCNLSCAYCDTPFLAGPTCRVESSPGSGTFDNLPNPLELSTVTALIRDWQKRSNQVHHSLSLTGGEPLVHADILKQWLPEVRPILPVFLETNGTLPAELEKIWPLVDLISMDIKGAAVTGTATPWAAHREFLEVAGGRLCQAKLVVDDRTPPAEILEAARLMSRHAPRTPLILQPRTAPAGPVLTGAALLAMQEAAAAEHHDVRIIPQIHPWLGVA